MKLSEICPVCKGSCNVMTTSRGYEYWTCPACGGDGVTVLYAPPMIGPGSRRAAGRAALESHHDE